MEDPEPIHVMTDENENMSELISHIHPGRFPDKKTSTLQNRDRERTHRRADSSRAQISRNKQNSSKMRLVAWNVNHIDGSNELLREHIQKLDSDTLVFGETNRVVDNRTHLGLSNL